MQAVLLYTPRILVAKPMNGFLACLALPPMVWVMPMSQVKLLPAIILQHLVQYSRHMAVDNWMSLSQNWILTGYLFTPLILVAVPTTLNLQLPQIVFCIKPRQGFSLPEAAFLLSAIVVSQVEAPKCF